jgi:hypothetical protein
MNEEPKVDSSLLSISGRAGVTTGASYFVTAVKSAIRVLRVR